VSESAWLIGYGIGVFISLFYVGVNYDDIDWIELGPLPILFAMAWPAAAPVVVGRFARKVAVRRRERRELAEKEARKWLEAPIP
jgi:hypothetical protein